MKGAMFLRIEENNKEFFFKKKHYFNGIPHKYTDCANKM